MWFRKETDDVTGGLIFRYTHEYWECKERQDWSRCPDIFYVPPPGEAAAPPLRVSGAGARAAATPSSVTVAAARPFVLLPAATGLHCVPSLPGPVLHTTHQTYHVLGRRHAPPRAPRLLLNPCRAAAAAAGPGSGHQRGAHHTHLTLTVPLVDLLHIKDPEPSEASGANAVLGCQSPGPGPGPGPRPQSAGAKVPSPPAPHTPPQRVCLPCLPTCLSVRVSACVRVAGTPLFAEWPCRASVGLAKVGIV
ncbi:Oxysterol-binding protein 1 [Portunus trituberculatus]|uniref:Oxysterol-binding protein 1 n=1 Tax=Portunus trituberculatus TaxID=210409 RepID=A0A5B7HSB7_PORTR|nr:Oxysterol-binding protein 1 [Portunus trituberculatus]